MKLKIAIEAVGLMAAAFLMIATVVGAISGFCLLLFWSLKLGVIVFVLLLLGVVYNTAYVYCRDNP